MDLVVLVHLCPARVASIDLDKAWRSYPDVLRGPAKPRLVARLELPVPSVFLAPLKILEVENRFQPLDMGRKKPRILRRTRAIQR